METKGLPLMDTLGIGMQIISYPSPIVFCTRLLDTPEWRLHSFGRE